MVAPSAFWAVNVLVAQSCPTLYDPMGCSPPGSSVHAILQARILQWVAIPFSRDLPDPGIEPGSPALQADSIPLRYLLSTELIGNLWNQASSRPHRAVSVPPERLLLYLVSFFHTFIFFFIIYSLKILF